ncbi:MAG: HlyC/CorC family transporter [Candidatus Cloacimonetes bacterium]|nr:HlyC/CorC family transporter [Candidatus Cloacimonadota bacterium]
MIGDIVLIIFLLLMSALFSGSEVSIFSLKDSYLESLKDKKGFLVNCLLSLIANKNACLIVILVGNLLVNIYLSSLVSETAMALFGEAGLAWAVLIMTLLILVFGEIVPKTIALKNATTFAFLSSPFLVLLKKLVFPLVNFLENLSNFFVNLIFGVSDEQDDHLSVDELQTMTTLGEKEGALKGWERQLIAKIFEFHEVFAVEKMTPRPDILAIEIGASSAEIDELIAGIDHSKILVYKDEIDFVVGYFQVKDYLLGETHQIEDIIKPVYVIPEFKPIHTLLKEMQIKNIKMAVLMDEYANVQGIITIEDLLQTIFGEMRDPSKLQSSNIAKTAQNRYLLAGTVSCREIDTYLQSSFFEDEFENVTSVAGAFLTKLNKLPEIGDIYTSENFDLVVHKVLKRRITEISLIVHEKKEDRE